MPINFSELSQSLSKHGIDDFAVDAEDATTEQKEAQQMEEQKRETEEYWKRKAAEPEPTTLQQARDAWRHYHQLYEKEDTNAYWRSKAEVGKSDASVLAQLASAEALTRIAEVLETMLEAQHD